MPHEQSVLLTSYLLFEHMSWLSIYQYTTADPEVLKWWTHWLVIFAANRTTLTPEEICMLYKHLYGDVMGGIKDMGVQDILDLYEYLRDDHEYAWEWERDPEYEQALRDLLNGKHDSPIHSLL